MAEEKTIGPLKAIRLKCMDCSNQQYKEVELCPCTDCPLYPFRFGHNPNRKGMGNHKADVQKSMNSMSGFDGAMNAPDECATEEAGS